MPLKAVFKSFSSPCEIMHPSIKALDVAHVGRIAVMLTMLRRAMPNVINMNAFKAIVSRKPPSKLQTANLVKTKQGETT